MAPYLAHFGVHISKMYFFCIHYQISRTHCLSYIDGIGNYISIADLIKNWSDNLVHFCFVLFLIWFDIWNETN
jgi:hypothetical protein